MSFGKVSRFHLLTVAAVLLSLAVPAWWLVATVYVIVVAVGVTFLQLQMFGPSLCRVRTQRKAVALTFDDGPDAAVTPALLDLLKTKNVSATFFVVGQRVSAEPELARRIVAEGHLIGNHSDQHSHATNLFRTQRLRQELSRAQDTIERVTGVRPTFYRPPVGLTNPRVFRVANELKLQVIGWTVRGLDKWERVPAKIADRIVRRLRPGAIIVLHDGGVPGSILLSAVEMLLVELKERGYRAERLDRLMEIK